MIGSRVGFLLMLALMCARSASARQAPSTHETRGIHLDVVVTAKSGPPVSDLMEQDFTVLDNGAAQKITSFVADGMGAPTGVVIVLDGLNAGSRATEIERQEIEKFLTVDGGRLAHPTSVAILADKGLGLPEEPSSDGNAISGAMQKRMVQAGVGRHADRLPAELFRLSIAGLGQLISKERDEPGRKIVIWVSPGWPTLSGLRASQDKEAYGMVVQLTRQLREARMTLYSLDPSRPGVADLARGGKDPSPAQAHSPGGEGDAVKGGDDASGAGWGNLALPALAMQTGGLALRGGEDVATQLQKCAGDAAAYYEISFVPVVSGQPNEYHRLEVRVAKPGLSARTQSGYYAQAPHASFFVANSESSDQVETDDSSYAHARPYLDRPLPELAEVVPELKNVRPASDQQQLAMILQKLGANVDNFMRDIGDLIAHEDIIQEKLDAKGRVHGRERVQNNYLIVHNGSEWGARAEYRMDNQGNRLGAVGLSKGFLVTSGFALSCIRFATAAQPQSRFRHLGDEKIGSLDTYVLGFAQIPGEVAFTTAMKGADGREVDVLTQGMLWVDKNNFQIIRIWSGLLAANAKLNIEQWSNELNFGEVQLQEVAHPLWLPSEVQVSMEINHNKYHNIHRYSDYRRYRVSARMVAPE